ncbi:hypothetical protein TI03_00875, partial [Achromatium sp. WMS1]
TTTRYGGVSVGSFSSLNLGDHVGDDPDAVAINRARLTRALKLPGEVLWLQQVHGCDAVYVGQAEFGCTADAAIALEPGLVCAVLTADCLPVLLYDQKQQHVGAVHAGWRGLLNGVLTNALIKLQSSPKDVLAWLGPAIGPKAFEVGTEVRTAFLQRYPQIASAFLPSPQGHWLADLYAIAHHQLTIQGVEFIGGGQWCTASDPEQFFSYRRDGITGRMASLIWMI